MSAKARLQALEAALKERGVVDVKFFFAKKEGGLSVVANDVADALEAMLAVRDKMRTQLVERAI